MAKQNVYDNEVFFENFKNIQSKKINFNDCIETPIFLSLLSEAKDETVRRIEPMNKRKRRKPCQRERVNT